MFAYIIIGFLILVVIAVVLYFVISATKKEGDAGTSTLLNLIDDENLFQRSRPIKMKRVYSPSENAIHKMKGKLKNIDIKHDQFDINIGEEFEDFTYQLSGNKKETLQNVKMEIYDHNNESVGTLSFIKMPGKETFLMTYDGETTFSREIALNSIDPTNNIINITFRDNNLIVNKSFFIFSNCPYIRNIKVYGEGVKKLVFLGIQQKQSK